MSPLNLAVYLPLRTSVSCVSIRRLMLSLTSCRSDLVPSWLYGCISLTLTSLMLFTRALTFDDWSSFQQWTCLYRALDTVNLRLLLFDHYARHHTGVQSPQFNRSHFRPLSTSPYWGPKCDLLLSLLSLRSFSPNTLSSTLQTLSNRILPTHFPCTLQTLSNCIHPTLFSRSAVNTRIHCVFSNWQASIQSIFASICAELLSSLHFQQQRVVCQKLRNLKCYLRVYLGFIQDRSCRFWEIKIITYKMWIKKLLLIIFKRWYLDKSY